LRTTTTGQGLHQRDVGFHGLATSERALLGEQPDKLPRRGPADPDLRFEERRHGGRREKQDLFLELFLDQPENEAGGFLGGRPGTGRCIPRRVDLEDPEVLLPQPCGGLPGRLEHGPQHVVVHDGAGRAVDRQVAALAFHRVRWGCRHHDHAGDALPPVVHQEEFLYRLPFGPADPGETLHDGEPVHRVEQAPVEDQHVRITRP